MNVKLVKPFVIPAMLFTYIGFFWFNMDGMELNASGFPRLLIIVIAGLMLTEVIRGIHKVRQHLRQREVVAAPAVVSAETVATETATVAAEATAELSEVATPTSAAATTPPADLTGWRKFMWHVNSPVGQTWTPMGIIVVFLFAYWFLLPVIGAFPSTALFVAGLSISLGSRKPWIILFSTAICVGLVAAFIKIFNLPLAGFILPFAGQ